MMKETWNVRSRVYPGKGSKPTDKKQTTEGNVRSRIYPKYFPIILSDQTGFHTERLMPGKSRIPSTQECTDFTRVRTQTVRDKYSMPLKFGNQKNPRIVKSRSVVHQVVRSSASAFVCEIL